jgi:cell wall-associated NlpC family hydrolase
VNTREIAQRAAKDLLEHRHKLAGNADDVQKVKQTLELAAKTITAHRDEHKTSAATATSHWDGKSATTFDHRATRMTRSLDLTATAAGKGAAILTAAAASVDGNRTAVNRLVEEYTTRAAQALDSGLGATGAGARGAMVKAAAQVRELIAHYTAESAKHLGAAQHDLRELAKQFKALEREVEHDGIVDPGKRAPKKHPAKHPEHPHKKHPHDKHPQHTDAHGTQEKVKDIARSQLGYHEGPGNSNKYGPAAPWCSSFATWVWRKAGVNIPITPFTGNVYRWGQQHHLAYDSHHLNQAKPGDVLLFGTGPQSPSTSTHIGIVESVHGNQVTLIEGNSGDQVRRVTHTLSSSTFYGGVHPR